MQYASRMIPNLRLAYRAASELDLARLILHVRNNLRTNLFQPNSSDSNFVTPNTVYIEPTMICNRHCDGCYPATLGTKSKIEESLAQNVFNAALQLNLHYVAWIGGEPLLPHVKDITLGVSQRNPKVAVVLCTNGDFLDGKVADRIGESPNIVPFISVDGFEENHNLRRGGKNSYSHVLRAMSYLKERSILFGYSTTVTSQNFMEVTSEKFVDEMIRNGAFVGSYLLFLSNSLHQLQPAAQQFAESVKRMNKLAEDKPLYVLSTEYGRLSGGPIVKGKRLIGMTVDQLGGVRTERGGHPIDRITDNHSLVDIIQSEPIQSIFRRKEKGSDDAPSDGGRRVIENRAFELLSTN